jgi:hypothetical protein
MPDEQRYRPAGAKARVDIAAFAARLKSCPATKHCSFAAGCCGTRGHNLYLGVLQALPENALPHHACRAKNQDFHRFPLRFALRPEYAGRPGGLFFVRCARPYP